jgi:predicted Rossmann-fold nucleotide-binding protein
VPSKYLTTEIKCPTLFERLTKLVELGDAYVILNGGTGTLLELSLVWESINKNLISEKPCASIGPMWSEIVSSMEKQIARENRKTGLIKCFDDADSCAEYIVKALNHS